MKALVVEVVDPVNNEVRIDMIENINGNKQTETIITSDMKEVGEVIDMWTAYLTGRKFVL